MSKPKSTRKRFSEKPIFAFTNSTVFVLDFLTTKPVWSHVLDLRFWTSRVSCQEASAKITNICMQGKYLTN